MSTEKLKPCAFCGSKNTQTVLLGGMWKSACGRCGSTSGLCGTETGAITAWNSRPASDLQQRLDKALGLLRRSQGHVKAACHYTLADEIAEFLKENEQ